MEYGRSIIRDCCDLTQLVSNDMRDCHFTLLDRLTLPEEPEPDIVIDSARAQIQRDIGGV